MQFWNELEGQVLEGIYPLRRLVRSEGRTAWFETEVHDSGVRPAIVSLTESLTDADEVTARLRTAQSLEHPNLLAIRKVGQAYLDQTLFVYAIMEHTDQNLSDVLRDQALSPEDARQVAEAMTGALTAIHQQGLVHGRVEPASVVSVGESVKLRSDCLQSPGAARAGDVAGIGATLFQAFTQRSPSSADDAQINRLPAPFAEIVRNTLSARWGLAQVAAALWPQIAPPQGAAAAVAVARPANPARAAGPQPLPVQPAVRPAEPPQAHEDEGEIAKTSRPTALYGAIVIALLVILGWLVFRPKSPAPTHLPVSATASPAASGQSPPPAALAATPPQTDAKPSADHFSAKPRSTAQTAEPGAGERTIWRVVAYTYRRQDQAQHKVDEITQGHSGLEAAVLSPKGDPNHYMVVIGGAMDRRQAFQMRDKAVSAGLPADTYVQNFSE